jgi:ribosome-associated heat shock protein Hsp15
MADADAPESLRLDRWLVHARFCKTRTIATELIAKKRVRINRIAATKPSRLVRPGDVLTLPRGHDVVVVRVLAIGERRGPATEAQALYDELSPTEAHTERGRRN